MNLHDDPDDIEYQQAMKLHMRTISDEQFQKFEGYAAEIFSAFGMDVNTPATQDTPRRFIQALFDARKGTTATRSCCASSTPNAAATLTAASAR